MKNVRFTSLKSISYQWLIVLILLVPDQITSQCHTPNPLPGSTCETAPLMCLQNLCYDSMPGAPDGAYAGFCGQNTAVHNPLYYEMVATSDSISLQILVGSCTGGQSALQSAIIAACPWQVANVLDCHPGAGQGQLVVMEAGGLQVGQSYWLLIDGGAGANCSFTITHASGIYAPEISEELTMISATPSMIILPGSDVVHLEVSPPIPFATGYYWVTDWNEDTITSSLPNIVPDIPHDLPTGSYSICAGAYSGCDTTETEVCTTIDVTNNDTTVSTIPLRKHSSIDLAPIPSDGTWSIGIEDPILLPVAWTLMDIRGMVIENGILPEQKSIIQLKSTPSQGMYYLRFISAGKHLTTSKVVIQSY